MKKRILLLLLLLFALLGTLIVVPRVLDGTLLPTKPAAESQTQIREPVTETMEPDTYPAETASKEPVTIPGPHIPMETEEAEDELGPPVDREKVVTEIMLASDIHYMSQSLTDYGKAFTELIDNGDGKMVRHMPQIWQAFAEEVILASPDVLVLSGDLTLNGEAVNHRELADHLAAIEAAGIPVLVIPGNHDINNPHATQYFGDYQTPVDTVTPQEFYDLYGEFGYYEAVSHAPDSLSYLYVLNETTWMLMLDSCIYDPANEVDGEIKEETMVWIEQCLKEAYKQGITVIPVAHHNLQELSRVYVEECVIRNYRELLELLERYLTPIFASGHLHVQRVQKHTLGPGVPETVYGITEFVSNSLIIPPCQYGKITLHADGSISYHTRNTNVTGWALRHGDASPELLEFTAYSENYIRSVIGRQTYNKIQYIPEHIKEYMVDFYAELYRDYYAGNQINYNERISEYGYQMWNRYLNPSKQFRQIEGMLKDSMVNNNNAEIPNPIHQTWER